MTRVSALIACCCNGAKSACSDLMGEGCFASHHAMTRQWNRAVAQLQFNVRRHILCYRQVMANHGQGINSIGGACRWQCPPTTFTLYFRRQINHRHQCRHQADVATTAFFQEYPGWQTWVGALVIISACLIVAFEERFTTRKETGQPVSDLPE